MKKNKTALWLVLASSALILAGCGKGSTSSSAAASSTATSSKTASSSTATSSSAQASSSAAGTSSSSAAASSSTASSSSTTSSSTTSSSSSTPASSSSSSSSTEPVYTDVAYADDTFVFAGESAEGTGRFVYWAGNGGTVSSATKANGKYTLAYKAAEQWYGVQIFYKLPYAESGDTYKVNWAMTSDVAGNITINSTVYALIAGDNNLTFTVSQAASSTLSVQLGVNTGNSVLGGASLSFALPTIYDTTAGATYNEVKFVNDTTTVKDIQVKNGKTVAAPEDPTPATGYIFDGWYNGTAEFNAKTAVTTAATYTAKFLAEADATKYTVTFMNGTTSMETVSIIKGKKVTVPATLSYPFGNTAMAWYKEAALTNVWDLDTDVVTADVSLYAKLKVTPSGTFMNTGDTAYKIPDADMTTNADGSLKVSGFAGWGLGRRLGRSSQLCSDSSWSVGNQLSDQLQIQD
jgi:hypothetical protein